MSNGHLFFIRQHQVATVPKCNFVKATDQLSKPSLVAGRTFFKYPAFSNTRALAASTTNRSFMKGIIIILSLFQIASSTAAQTLANGYYLTTSNDTIRTKLKISTTLFGKIETISLQNRLRVLDSISTEVSTFSPNQIQGYGFEYNNRDRNFVTRTAPGEKPHFYERISDGKIMNCLYYADIRDKMTIQIFILERKDSKSAVLKLPPMKFKKIKPEIEEIFKDKQDILAKIDSFELPKRHIKESLIQLTSIINQK